MTIISYFGMSSGLINCSLDSCLTAAYISPDVAIKAFKLASRSTNPIANNCCNWGLYLSSGG